MLTKDKLAALNALAKKAKNGTLTKEEEEKRQVLRAEYLNNVRASFKNQLGSMTIIDPVGNDVTPKKMKALQAENEKK